MSARPVGRTSPPAETPRGLPRRADHSGAGLSRPPRGALRSGSPSLRPLSQSLRTGENNSLTPEQQPTQQGGSVLRDHAGSFFPCHSDPSLPFKISETFWILLYISRTNIIEPSPLWPSSPTLEEVFLLVRQRQRVPVTLGLNMKNNLAIGQPEQPGIERRVVETSSVCLG